MFVLITTYTFVDFENGSTFESGSTFENGSTFDVAHVFTCYQSCDFLKLNIVINFTLQTIFKWKCFPYQMPLHMNPFDLLQLHFKIAPNQVAARVPEVEPPCISMWTLSMWTLSMENWLDHRYITNPHRIVAKQQRRWLLFCELIHWCTCAVLAHAVHCAANYPCPMWSKQTAAQWIGERAPKHTRLDWWFQSLWW